MKVTFMINDRKIDLLSPDMLFTEGEKIEFEEQLEKHTYMVSSIRKALTVVGDNAECSFIIRLQ